jgi:methylated-DNA-protein-cysteine methyltransferase-like protein
MSETVRDRVLRVVREIPPGHVSTYGDVARFAGAPRAAREVGWALSSLPEGSDVPWWRVVNRFGAISPRGHGSSDQRSRLEEEGLLLGVEGRIDLNRFGWDGPGPRSPL